MTAPPTPARAEPKDATAALLELASEALLTLRSEPGGHRVVQANQAAAQLLGAEAGRTLADIPLLAPLGQTIDGLADDGVPSTLTREGAGVVLRITMVRRDGLVLLAVSDLSERVRAETRLVNAIERLNDGFVLYDADDRIVLFNRRFQDYYPQLAGLMRPGMRFEEILREAAARGLLRNVQGDLEAALAARLDAHRNPGEPFERHLADGRVIRIQEHRTADGGLVSLGVDVTALHAGERRFRDLVEGSLQGILIHRFDQPLFANEAYARIHAFPSVEAVLATPSLWIVVPEEERSRFGTAVASVQAGGPTQMLHGVRGLRLDGRELWVDISLRRIDWTDGPALQTTIVDVTERITAETALRETTGRLRDLIDGSVQGIVIHRGLTPLYANDAYARLYGFRDPEEVVAQGSLDFTIPVENRPRALTSIQRIMEGGSPLVRSRVRALRRDGTQIWTEIALRRVDWTDGPAVQSTVIDVTDQALAEEALAASEARFRDLVGTVPGMVYQWYERPDGSHGYSYVSARSQEMYGIGPEELLRDWTRLRIHPDDLERWAESVRQAVRTNGDWSFEGRWLLPDGRAPWWRGVSRPVRKPDGTTLFNGIVIDIDEQKRAEAELRYREAMLRFTASLAGLGFWVWDRAQFRITYASPELADIWGVTVERYLEEYNGFDRQLPHIHPDDRTRYAETAIQPAKARAPYAIEYRILRADGEVRHVREVGGPVFDGTGELVKYVGALQDITDRRRREVELEAARDRLERQAAEMTALARELEGARDAAEQASRAKSRFLAVMSHELRTPMTGVIGMVDLLSATSLSDEQRGHLQTLRSSADSLLVVLNDILDFSKIEAGQLVIEAIPVRLGRLLGDVTQLFGPAASQKGITLALTPPPGGVPDIVSDPTRLRQVLMNLVGNAVKFTGSGRIELRMPPPRRLEGDLLELRFEVRDTGIGIDAAAQPFLFEAFTQADATTTRRFGGTGLGLAICKRLVGMMGGEIGVDSKPGEGSTFWFTIHAKPGNPPAGEPSPVPPAVPSDTVGARILLAEDNEVNQLLVVTMLGRLGHVVDAVANGRLAVEAARSKDYDLVLMDMQMPEMDGDAAAEAIRDLPGWRGRLPIVGLSADALPEDLTRRRRARLFDDYLTKPVDWNKLAQTIARLTGRGRQT